MANNGTLTAFNYWARYEYNNSKVSLAFADAAGRVGVALPQVTNKAEMYKSSFFIIDQ